MFQAFYSVSPSHFKLDKQQIVNSIKQQQLAILYSNYKIIQSEVIPTKISISAQQKKQFTQIDATFKSIKLNTAVNTSFKIPTNYKRLNL